MNKANLIQALGLPENTRINQRVAKKMLVEHVASTAADKRLIQDGVDEITWLAALKPHLIGIPAYEDEHRHYQELAVLSLDLKTGTKPGRLVELLHRAVPYPVLLFTTSDSGLSISLAHLRKSQNETDQMVIDGQLLSVTVPSDVLSPAFFDAWAIARQPHTDLYRLYQGLIDTVDALDIARETGMFQRSLTPEHAAERREVLRSLRDLDEQVRKMRAEAQKVKQVSKQVALNLEIQKLTKELAMTKARLNEGDR